MKTLCKHPSIDVNIQDKCGQTPLHFVSGARYLYAPNTVKVFCEQSSIDVNIRDKNGWTPLHHASFGKDTDIMEILHSVPTININIKNNNGKTPMEIYGRLLSRTEFDEIQSDNSEMDNTTSFCHKALLLLILAIFVALLAFGCKLFV